MKAIKSNTRIAFAYQDSAAAIAQTNANVNPSSGGYYIRVVQPGRVTLRSAGYDPLSTGIEPHFAIDKLITARCVRIKQFGCAGRVNDTTFSGAEYSGVGEVTDQIHTVQTIANRPECYIVDIKLKSDAWNNYLENGIETIAFLELLFESGVTEFLQLHLRSENDLLLSIDPSLLSLTEEFTVNTKAGNVGTLIHAHQISKTYRDVATRASQYPDYYCIGNSLDSEGGAPAVYSTFMMPWGMITDKAPASSYHTNSDGTTPTSLYDASETSALWTQPATVGGDGLFVTSHSSSLSWFSGKADMTTRYAPALSAVEDGADAPVELYDFFEFVPTHHSFTSSSQKTRQTMFAGASNAGTNAVVRWGQRNGWNSSFVDPNITHVPNPSGVDQPPLLAPFDDSAGDMLFGVPMPLRRQSTGATKRAFMGGGSGSLLRNELAYGRGTNSTYSSLLESWGSGNYGIAWDGHGAYPSDVTNINNGTTPFNGIDGPTAARYRNLLCEMGQAGTTSRQDGQYITGFTGNVLDIGNLTNSTALTIGQDNFLRKFDPEKVKTIFAPIATIHGSNMSTDMANGTTGNLVLNNGRNFFHASHAGDGQRSLEPIFQGKIRFIKIFRFGQSSAVSTLSGVSSAISSKLIEEGADYINALDLRGVFYGSQGNSEDVNAKYSARDMLFSLLYNTSGTMPSEDRHHYSYTTYNGSNDVASKALNEIAALTLSSSWNGNYAPGGSPITGLGTDFNMKAQDIAYINTVNVEQPLRIGPSASSPIGSPFKNIPTYYSPNSNKYGFAYGVNSHQTSENESQVGYIDIPGYEVFKETTGLSVPKYPIAIIKEGGFADQDDIAATWRSHGNVIRSHKYGSGPLAQADGLLWFTSAGVLNDSGLCAACLPVPWRYYGDGPSSPNVSPNAEASQHESFIVRSGSNGCFKVLSSSVKIGGGTQAIGDPGGQKIQYSMVFENTCASDFLADDNTIVVQGGTLASKVTKVLQIFPTIEIRTLSSYAPNNLNPLEDVNPLGLAYKITVTDEDDVDDIQIIANSTSDQYTLIIELTQDSTDVYNSPDDNIDDDLTISNTQFFLDVPTSSTTGLPTTDENSFAYRYGQYAGHPDFSYIKASFITISTVADWTTLGNELVTNELIGPYYANQHTVLAGNDSLVYHHPFLTFGTNDNQGIQDVIDESQTILGCTDPDAINYNPEATDDDGSCLLCEDQANNQGLDLSNDGLGYAKAGVNGANSPSYLYGLVGGATTTPADIGFVPFGIFGPISPASQGTSYWLNYGGAVITDNYFVGDPAVIEGFEIGIGLQGGTSQFNTMLSGLEEYVGNDSGVWDLRIIPWTEEVASLELSFSTSYSANNPAPADVDALPAILTSSANAGTLYNPRWTWDILQNVSFQAGVPYMLELKLAPKSGIPVGCDTYASDQARTYSIMWTAFCGCGTIGNDYFIEGLNGSYWPWNTGVSFPILSYGGGNGSTYTCPDIPNQLNGPLDYPQSVCLQRPDQATECDGFFLYCVAQQTPECQTNLALIEDLNTDTYQEGGSYYFDYSNYSILVQIEGYYNVNSDSFIPIGEPGGQLGIPFNVTVAGPDGYSFEFNENTATFISSGITVSGGTPVVTGIYSMEFEDMTSPGEYTVTYTFPAGGINQPYPDFFPEENIPCTFTETVVVAPPSTICEEIIPGCTDPTSETYDPNANFDNGTCEFVDPCEEIFNNTDLPVTASTTNSGSNCIQEEITVGGITYTANVVVPSNTGTLTSSVVYDVPETGLDSGLIADSFAFLIFPIGTSTAVLGFSDTITTTTTIFSSGLFPSGYDAADAITFTDPNTGELLFAFSPLFEIGAVDATFTYTFSNLAPNSYKVLAIPNLETAQLNECTEAPVIRLEEGILEVTVGMDPTLEDCPEPCIGDECDGAKPGCTDPSAENYNPEATIDDGSCLYPQTFCEEYPDDPLCIDCDDATQQAAPRQISGKLADTICDPVNGSDGECTDPNACNYNPDAPLDTSNNQLCDYCSCVGEDPDCDDDQDCDPDIDPECADPEPECPDPGNPNCDPVIYDPCPTGDCPPPQDPCLILGNCPDGGGDGPTVVDDPFIWDEPVIELECIPQVAGVDSNDEYFDEVILKAFQCMSDEGKKMLFKLAAGVEYDEEDLIKLSLIAYLLNGGADNATLPCIFNCNYDSRQKAAQVDCRTKWTNSGGRFWNSQDNFVAGSTVVHFVQKNGIITRNIYTADRNIERGGLLPQFMNSGWHRCTSVRVRTKDVNGIADGTENYLQIFWEYLTRFCTSCEVGPSNTTSAGTGENVVDPKILKGYIDPKTNNNTNRTGSGILGEDGDEIIF